LLTTFLLRRAGYDIGRFVSLEQLIFDTKDAYYRELMASTNRWFDDGHHDAWPWIRYLLHRIEDAYDRLEERVTSATSPGSKQDRVRHFIIAQTEEHFTIADIRRALPGVSDQTIRLVLSELQRSGVIESEGTGRGATWRRRHR
jgi:Fic family protein